MAAWRRRRIEIVSVANRRNIIRRGVGSRRGVTSLGSNAATSSFHLHSTRRQKLSAKKEISEKSASFSREILLKYSKARLIAKKRLVSSFRHLSSSYRLGLREALFKLRENSPLSSAKYLSQSSQRLSSEI
jgi:hypothetical protein